MGCRQTAMAFFIIIAARVCRRPADTNLKITDSKSRGQIKNARRLFVFQAAPTAFLLVL
jgi:hypothetical protein